MKGTKMKFFDLFHHTGNGIAATSAVQPAPTFNIVRCSAELPDVLCDAARRRWKIFPVLGRSKYAMGITAMMDQATCDLAQLEAWYIDYPGCNWAMATGPAPASGVLVAEMDGALGVFSFTALALNHLDTDWAWHTLISQAGPREEDTIYAYFRWPEGLAMRNFRADIARGLRLRGPGDCVLLPPSISANGSHHFYRDSYKVADTPKWLVELAAENSAEDAGAPAKFPPRRADAESSEAFGKPSFR
jgi:hypothetical protein